MVKKRGLPEREELVFQLQDTHELLKERDQKIAVSKMAYLLLSRDSGLVQMLKLNRSCQFIYKLDINIYQ